MQSCFQFFDFENFREIISKISRISSFLKKPKFPPKIFFLSKKDIFCWEKKSPVYGIVKLGENIIIISMTQPNWISLFPISEKKEKN